MLISILISVNFQLRSIHKHMPLPRKWYANHSFQNGFFLLSSSSSTLDAVSESPANQKKQQPMSDCQQASIEKSKPNICDRMKQINLIIYRSHMTLNSKIMISMREMRIFEFISIKQNLSNPNTCNNSYMMSDISIWLWCSVCCWLLFLPVAQSSSQQQPRRMNWLQASQSIWNMMMNQLNNYV